MVVSIPAGNNNLPITVKRFIANFPLSTEDYLAGLWRNNLKSVLCWIVLARESPYIQAPSWSWASVQGAIAWLPFEETKDPVVIEDVKRTVDDTDPTGKVPRCELTISGPVVSIEYVRYATQPYSSIAQRVQIKTPNPRTGKYEEVLFIKEYYVVDNLVKYDQLSRDEVQVIDNVKGTIMGCRTVLLFRCCEENDIFGRIGCLHEFPSGPQFMSKMFDAAQRMKLKII
ncbi:hypothetical protein M426DRAFT_11617 [Hypoxylon sp. CI-4A]|nr:hypothetical protein M426DRAFT_11617 [Hypoxylon sp. CI-4A]